MSKKPDLGICFLTEHFHPKKGGSSTYTESLTRYLSEIGVRIQVITYDFGSEHVSSVSHREIDYICVPSSLRKERFFPIFAFYKTFSVLKNKKIDIIHVGYGFFAIYLGVFMGHIFRKPVVFTIHNVPPREMLVERFSWHTWLHKTFKRFYLWLTEIFGKTTLRLPYSTLICVSERTSMLAQKVGALKRKVSVIPNGVDVEKFRPLPKQKMVQGLNLKDNIVLLNVAGFIEHKGQKYLVEAMPDLIQKFPNIRLLLVGLTREKKYKQYVLNLIKSLKIEELVHILENVPYDEIADIFNACDIYVQPSLEEGFCISLLEAMACGKPVVGTRTGAIPTFIDASKGGILIWPGSSGEVYKAVIALLSDNEKMKEMGSASRRYAKDNYSWESIAKKTLEEYMKLALD